MVGGNSLMARDDSVVSEIASVARERMSAREIGRGSVGCPSSMANHGGGGLSDVRDVFEVVGDRTDSAEGSDGCVAVDPRDAPCVVASHNLSGGEATGCAWAKSNGRTG